ncbi:MAG: glycosyltransferase family 1 protein [Gammaproteobacteria bacterium]|nr:glycosyltransferase family 1 protein [Gammaproteobacteria bacterium]
MRIGMQTWGSHGDIRPFMALASGLQSAGHDVTLLVTSVDGVNYSGSASALNIKLEHIASPVLQTKEEYAQLTELVFNATNPITQIKTIMTKALVPVEQEMYRAAEKLCQDNDIIIGHYFHYPIQTAAQKFTRPYVSIALSLGGIPSVNIPPAGAPNWGRGGNRFFWWLAKSILNKGIKPYVDRLRVQQGLAPADDMLLDVWFSSELNLIAVSPELCEQQEDWPENHRVCGFFNLPNIKNEGTVSSELEKFLTRGPAPVYMTFGSMVSTLPELQIELLTLFTQATELVGCRAIIQASLWKECRFESSATIHYVSHSPHGLVFPRCAAVVHHGGAGTSQAATRAGLASIVVAHIDEQKSWGAALKRMGVAPGVLVRKNLTSKALAKKIHVVLGSLAMQERAKAIGKSMRKEDGVRNAVELINEKFKKM